VGRLIVAAVLAAVVVTGCGSDTSGAEAFTAEDAVECRELGGGWVHTRYEADGQAAWGTRYGLTPESATSAADFDGAVAERVANGWDDAALEGLAARELDAATATRLAAMPSCLDELRDRGVAP
jgi:hypothetical protein